MYKKWEEQIAEAIFNRRRFAQIVFYTFFHARSLPPLKEFLKIKQIFSLNDMLLLFYFRNFAVGPPPSSCIIQRKETLPYLLPFFFLNLLSCVLANQSPGWFDTTTQGQLTSFFFLLFFFYFLVLFFIAFQIKSNEKKRKKKRGDITRMRGDVERLDIPHYAITGVCVCVLVLCFLRFSVREKVNKFHAVKKNKRFKKKKKLFSVENGRINSIVCDFSRATIPPLTG